MPKWAGGASRPANPCNLMGFLDAFKAVLTLPWRGRVDANPAMRSIVRRAAGWGDSLSLRAAPELRDRHPTPSRILRCEPTLPPPGEGEESSFRVSELLFRFSEIMLDGDPGQ